MTKDLDQKVAHAMGLKSVNNCEKWGTSMTQEALKLVLEALEELYNTNSNWWQEVDEQTLKKIEHSITAIKEALAQPQEPVSSDPLPRACNLAGVDYQTFLKIKAYMPVAPPQRTEQNFCPRCGKRTKDIHTCTPPRENT